MGGVVLPAAALKGAGGGLKMLRAAKATADDKWIDPDGGTHEQKPMSLAERTYGRDGTGKKEPAVAAYLKTAYQMLADQGVKAAYWYADRNTSQSDVNQANFGVMNYDLSAKPAYTALAGLSVVSDPKDAQIISLSAQVVALTTQVDDLTTQLKTANDQLSTAEANLATAQLRINNALTALS